MLVALCGPQDFTFSKQCETLRFHRVVNRCMLSYIRFIQILWDVFLFWNFYNVFKCWKDYHSFRFLALLHFLASRNARGISWARWLLLSASVVLSLICLILATDSFKISEGEIQIFEDTWRFFRFQQNCCKFWKNHNCSFFHCKKQSPNPRFMRLGTNSEGRSEPRSIAEASEGGLSRCTRRLWESTAARHGRAVRLPDDHLSHLTNFLFRFRKKKMFFSNYFKKHAFVQRKQSFVDLMEVSSGNSHLRKKRKALEVNPPVSRANFQIPRCHSKSLHLS